MSHPSFEELNAFVDGQGTGAFLKKTQAHVADCPDCARFVDRIRGYGRFVHRALMAHRPSGQPVKTADCMDEEDLARLVDGEHGADRAAFSMHLSDCDYCMNQLAQVFRMSEQTYGSPFAAVPEHLRREEILPTLVHATEAKTPDNYSVIKMEPGIPFKVLATSGDVTVTETGFTVSAHNWYLKLVYDKSQLTLELLRGAKPTGGKEVLMRETESGRRHFRGKTDLSGKAVIKKVGVSSYDLQVDGERFLVRFEVVA